MSPTKRILIGLLTGLAAGSLLPALGASASGRVVAFVEPFGNLWVNAIRMTVIPMVVSLLIVGVGGSRDTAAIGRVGRHALFTCAAMLAGAAVLMALLIPPLLRWVPLSAATIEALRTQAGAGAAAAAPLSFGDWLTSLLPANPIKAAADGALLPLVLFALLVGLAATRVEGDARPALLAFFRGVAEAMLVLVRWVLAVAPAGVFALAVALAARTGTAAVGALASYVVLVAVLSIVLMAGCVALVLALGGVPLRPFLSGTGPAAAVAFSSRSSLAALPALVEGGNRLQLPGAVVSFFLPLAVAAFKLASVQAMIIGPLFLAKLYGIAVGPGQVAAIALTAILLSFSVPGIPAGVILVMAPTLASLGVPAAGLGLLLAIDTVPDMFRTMTNVTADMAAATVIAARGAEAAPAAK